MGRSRPRYNEKARASSLQSKVNVSTLRLHPNARNGGLVALKKKVKSINSDNTGEGVTYAVDQNPVQSLHKVLQIQTESKMSKTRKKKLEKYIEKKLKKEQHGELMEKVALSSKSVDSRNVLIRSSAGISSGVNVTERERVRYAFNVHRAGIMVDNDALFQQQQNDDSDKLDNNDDDQKVEQQQSIEEVKPTTKHLASYPVKFGSALKSQKTSKQDSDEQQQQKKRKLMPEVILNESSSDSDSSFDDEDNDNVKEVQKIIDRKPANQATVSESAESKPKIAQDDTVKLSQPKLVNHVKNENTSLQQKYADRPRVQAKYVLVERNEDIQQARLQLPILAEEHTIMEKILSNEKSTCHMNDVLVLCGETGSGKTSQLPQFLFEYGFGSGHKNGNSNNSQSFSADERAGLIGVTQPRRVAAVSIAQRVQQELGVDGKVAYQVRYDTNVSLNTAIKFMTDGILLKEISKDLLLTKYSCIVVDEAHERSLNTDILIGLLSRVVPLRRKMFQEKRTTVVDGKSVRVYPLKLVIMSATLRVDDFVQNQQLFKLPPPLIEVKARQFPVTVHFNKTTPENYIEAAYDKVCKIHKKLPPGGILVFLTGQQEIAQLISMLQNERGLVSGQDDYDQLPGRDDDQDDDENLEEGFTQEELKTKKKLKLHVLPLFALQSTEHQMRIFEKVSEHHRLCIVATNVAETSLTIPGIKYVVDCGRVKELSYDIENGVSSFKNVWTSKASADQRSGRAGRCEAGHTYRLYSSAVYQYQMQQHTAPEIQRMPIDGVVLQMKNMEIDNVCNFPFPSPPDRQQLQQSEKMLVSLGALDFQRKSITPMGRQIANYPIHPRYGKMIVFCIENHPKLLPFVVLMVSALTVGEIFDQTVSIPGQFDFSQNDDEDQQQQQDQQRVTRNEFNQGYDSDPMLMAEAVLKFIQHRDIKAFCIEYGLRLKAMQEVQKLSKQIFNIINAESGIQITVDQLRAFQLHFDQVQLVKDVILSANCDRIAIRCKKQHKGQKLIPYKAVFQEVMSFNSDIGQTAAEYIYIHPSSCLVRSAPEFVLYQDLRRASSSPLEQSVLDVDQNSGQTSQRNIYMLNITQLDSLQSIATVNPSICFFGNPLENPCPYYDSQLDAMYAYSSPTIGSNVVLNLPPTPILLSQFKSLSNGDKLRQVAKLILDGSILPKLKSNLRMLNAKPQLMINPKLGINNGKIAPWIQSLSRHDVLSHIDGGLKRHLMGVFKEHNKFLLEPYLQWITQDYEKVIRGQWPPL
ncbi:hypothetical protein MP228_009509 [Amoeboaphelidium protococcarum]|nr:hypothetical protein MP228_009509 [Amoeboaphelidium protococcarum]